jgi:carbon-monoxide dehydrogenase large subunit
MLEKVKQLTAHLLNASADAVTLEDGMIHIEGAPEMSRSLSEIADIAYGQPGRMPEGMDLGLETSFRYNPPPMTFASAAHACVVEVDVDTGFVKILRWICSEDCGVVINPGVVEGQIAGGLAQAIGMVLLEDLVIDENGAPATVTFKDYLMPQISDVPDFEYTHIVTPAANPGGFRGVGEGGAIIGPPTLINAIHDALAPFGVTCLDLPLKPAKLLAAIDAARGSQAA